MSTFYLDLVNGDDAKDGTTWAKAWKTFNNGPRVDRIAPGDLIKVAKTPDPISLGINATWNDNSYTLALASALTKNIEMCESAWSVATNVTDADETYYFKEGTKSRKFSIAAAFVSGKIAYKSFASQNFSAYSKITFWIRTNAFVNSNVLKICLCSDVNGNTIVNTATISDYFYSNRWYAFTISTGALGAAIQSVALYANSDPGTITIYLDDILACGNLDLRTLIGKNIATDTFWPIRSINDTTVRLGNPQDNATYGLVYRGVSETVALYRKPTFNPWLSAGDGDYLTQTNKSGEVNNLITFSGGWNTVSGLQDGETWIDGIIGYGWGLYLINRDYVKLDHISYIRCYYGIRDYDNCTGIQLDTVECSFNQSYGLYCYSSDPIVFDSDSWVLRTIRAYGNSSFGIYSSNCHKWDVDTVRGVNTYMGIDAYKNNYSSWKNITCLKNSGYGFLLQSSYDVQIDTTDCDYNGSPGVGLSTCPNINAKNIGADNNLSDGLRISQSSGAVFDNVDCASNSDNGVDISNSINVKIKDLTTSGNASGALVTYDSQVFLNNPSMGEAIKIYFDLYYFFGRDQFVSVKKYQQTANDHRIFLGEGTITSETAIRHTASGLAWKMTPLRAGQKLRLLPNNFKLTVIGNKEVTINVYVRKNAAYNGNAPRLVLIGGVLSGISSDVVDSLSVGVDTWEQLEVKGTPTESGVLEFYVDCDGTAGDIFVDDFGVFQAA